jgi:hypothetical protein
LPKVWERPQVNQRFRCNQCYKSYSERPDTLDGAHTGKEEIAKITRLIVEGFPMCSIE